MKQGKQEGFIHFKLYRENLITFWIVCSALQNTLLVWLFKFTGAILLFKSTVSLDCHLLYNHPQYEYYKMYFFTDEKQWEKYANHYHRFIITKNLFKNYQKITERCPGQSWASTVWDSVASKLSAVRDNAQQQQQHCIFPTWRFQNKTFEEKWCDSQS